MNTSLFSNMFKSLFGEQITPTSDQFVPITASDGTPAGISSIANLQSVLGVIFTGSKIEIKWVSNIEPFLGTNSARLIITPNTNQGVVRQIELAIQCENQTNIATPTIKVKSIYANSESAWGTVFTP